MSVLDALYTASWRVPGRTWRRLYAFAEAEHESALELRCAAASTPDASRAALYLKHAEDETRHARILRRRAEVARGEPLPPPRTAHADLFARLGEVGFLAFVFRGERRGRRQFEAHVRFFAGRDPALCKALSAILDDERRHERYTHALLTELSERPGRELRRVAWRERRMRWGRAGAWLTAPIFALLMFALYILSSPLALFVRRDAPGWRD